MVAVARPDGRYDCYHSQWGGEHLDRLVASVRDGGAPPDLVDPDPVSTAVPAGRVLDRLGSRGYEALVAADGAVEAFLVCRPGIETGRPPDADGPAETRTEPAASFVRDAVVLVPWTDEATAARVRRFSRTAKEVLGDAVDAGLLPAWAATGYLPVRLTRHPDVRDEIVWFPSGVIPQCNRRVPLPLLTPAARPVSRGFYPRTVKGGS